MQENALKNVQQKPGNELTKLNRVSSHCYNSNIRLLLVFDHFLFVIVK